MPKFLKFILTRTFILYAICLFVVWHLIDFNQLAGNAVPQTLSRLTPPMDYFAEFVDKTGDYNWFKLMNCINYHQAVIRFFPYQKAEAYGMLGFCYERLGRAPEAINAYTQAIAANPDYFWPYYNLGVLAYRQGRYREAAEYLHQALELQPVKSLLMLPRSKVYNDVRLSKAAGDYDYLQGLQDGRKDAYLLMNYCLYKISHPSGEEALNPRVRFF